MPARETGKIPCFLPASDVQQLQKDLPNGRVVLPREFLRQPRVNHSEEIVCPGSSTEHENHPRALQVWHGFDALQEEAVFLELTPQLGFHELLISQGGPQHNNPLLVIGVISLPAWRMCWQPGGKKSPLLNSCVLPKLMRMPA